MLLEVSPQLTVKLYDPSLRSGRATLFSSELPFEVFLVSQTLMKSVEAVAFAGRCALRLAPKAKAKVRQATTNFFMLQ